MHIFPSGQFRPRWSRWNFLVMALWLPLLSLARLTSLITLMVFTLVDLSLWWVKRRAPRVSRFSVPVWLPVAGFFINLVFIAYQLLHWR